MSSPFAERTVVVTGASRGIGQAIAIAFAQAGANLVVNATQPSTAMEETLASLAHSGARATAVYGDVADVRTAEALISASIERDGRIDILINNAGITRDKPLMLMSETEWDSVVDVNLRGVFACSRAAMRPMIAQKSGRIISVSSISAISGRPGQCAYSAAKAGIIGFTKSLAREVGHYGILVNALLVGAVETEMTKRLPRPQRESITRLIPLGRMGRPTEVAGPCLFLAGEDASFVTGTTINVSGGGYV